MTEQEGTQRGFLQQLQLLKEISENTRQGAKQTQEQAKKLNDRLQKLQSTVGEIRDEYRANQDWINLGIAWTSYFIIISIPVVKGGFDGAGNILDNIANSTGGRFLNLHKLGNQDFAESPIKKGETIAGYEITSAKGKREAPCAGCSSEHNGVDIATPMGTSLYTPAKVKVSCWIDSQGGGLVAEFKLNGAKHKFLHLSTCNGGTSKSKARKYGEDEIFATTGTGGTGAHLDYRVQKGKDWLEPPRSVLLAVLDPKAKLTSFSVAAYKNAVATQESGHNYRSINPDSGALGKYQFMPSTLKQYSKSCLGKTITNQQFLQSQSYQEQIMDCYLTDGLEQAKKISNNPNIQCRALASFHYSGDVKLWNNKAKQYSNGKEYPSIAEYTTKVCQQFR